MSLVVLYVLAGALVALLFFHGYIFSRLAFRDQTAEPDRDLPVSVVICARNEARALEHLIPLLLDQDHREFEVVVVNDRSEDDTWEILQWMKPEHPRLRPVNIQADEKFNYGKKLALGVGIRSAKYPHLLLTDADCLPVGRDWLSLMASGFRNDRHIVIGHSPYEKKGPGFANLLERYDGASKAMQYISFAQAGLPYMGTGRNLGYTHEVFFAVSGPRRHHHLMSGDDDLFINEVARARNTSAVADPRSFMTTRASADLDTWLRRKRRHYTTARYYRFGHQFLLTLMPLARMLFWACVVSLFFLGHWPLALGALGLELLLFLPVRLKALYKLGSGRSILWLALPLEWLFLLLEPVVYFSTLIRKPRRWK
ncbi:MAG: glycosyltransferase [Flavobacteriales bacterium]|nr:glycosyltransferase [Flavobacteriales bacterium]